MTWRERKKSAIVKLNLTGLNIFNGEVPELSFRRREGPGGWGGSTAAIGAAVC